VPKITLASLDNQTTREAVSDPDGTFQFLNVKAGRYEITAVAEELTGSRRVADRLDWRLQPGDACWHKCAEARHPQEPRRGGGDQ
jgi:hypothetical protein